MDGEVTGGRPASPRLGRILGGVAIVAVASVAAFLLFRALRPQPVTATALFEVSSTAPSVLSGTGETILDDREYEILKKTQLALLRSNFVLQAAIRNPSIAGMSLLQRTSDPVEWLQENLIIEFPQDGEILSISLSGAEADAEELVKVVDAVAKAYKDEVVNERRQRRFATRDLLARNLENLNSELKRKMEEYLDIARESGKFEGGGDEILRQLDAKRLDRVEDEIMRLESAQAIEASGDAPKRKAIDDRLSQLREQLAGLSKELKSRTERSADLELRQHDVELLQRIANEMSMKLEQLDVDASSPDRIKQVQQAVPSRSRSGHTNVAGLKGGPALDR